MANSNDYLPFATGGGANVLDQADYSALTARSAGFVAGTALSVQLNKVWRQGSMVAAMIGQFTADYGPGNVVDDGNIANYEAQFVAALGSFIPQDALLHYGVAGGTANALTVTVTPTITAYTAGLCLLVKASNNNTGAATINAQSLGVVNITRTNLTALQAFDIETGAVLILIYDGTEFQLAGSFFFNEAVHYGVDTSGVANTVTVANSAFNPPVSSMVAGTTLQIKIANTNTGATTVNGFTVNSPQGGSLVAGALNANAIATFIYDGTQLWLQTAQATNTSTSTGGLTSVATAAPIFGDGLVADPVSITTASTSQLGAVQLATAAQFAANSGSGNALSQDQAWLSAQFQTPAFSTSITLDFSTGWNFNVGTLTNNFTLNNPTNGKPGQEGVILLTQDGTGSRTATLGSAWQCAGGFPGLSTAPNAVDALVYKYVNSGFVLYSLLQGVKH